MSDAKWGHGIALHIFNNGVGDDPDDLDDYTKVAEVMGLDFNPIRETADVTNFDSEEGWDESIKTIKRGGEVPIDLNFVPGNEILFEEMTENDDVTKIWIVFPKNLKQLKADAHVINYAITGRTDDAVRAKATIKISGKPDFGAYTPPAP